MRTFNILGGCALKGEVSIGGAKNSSLAVISAAIMNDEDCILTNVPHVSDVVALVEALRNIGAKAEWLDENSLIINGKDVNPDEGIAYEAIKKIRASYYLLGALLGKYNKAKVSLPGGCNIGARPIDQHLKGFRALGAKIKLSHGMMNAKADSLNGAEIMFDNISVGATINVMMAASLANGRTILNNAAEEPHVVDVANFLNAMGADIVGAGTRTIIIDGVKSFNKKIDYRIIPDQIEAGTFMVAAAMTHGDVMIKDILPAHLSVISCKLRDMGAIVEEGSTWVRVTCPGVLKGSNIITGPYPGFPTDMQAQFAAAFCVANDMSVVEENIFENRFVYAGELRRLGAIIMQSDNCIIISGTEGDMLSGAEVSACDLRAGAALVLAGLVADGLTTVHNIEYIERGYEKFDYKLRQLGANITLVES